MPGDPSSRGATDLPKVQVPWWTGADSDFESTVGKTR